MQNSQHGNPAVDHQIEHAIGKPAQQRAANAPMDVGVEKWIFRDAFEGFFDAAQEVFAQTTTTVDLEAVFADIGTIVAPVERLRELTVWVAVVAIALLLAAGVLAGLARPRAPRPRMSEASRPA